MKKLNTENRYEENNIGYRYERHFAPHHNWVTVESVILLKIFETDTWLLWDVFHQKCFVFFVIIHTALLGLIYWTAVWRKRLVGKASEPALQHIANMELWSANLISIPPISCNQISKWAGDNIKILKRIQTGADISVLYSVSHITAIKHVWSPEKDQR